MPMLANHFYQERTATECAKKLVYRSFDRCVECMKMQGWVMKISRTNFFFDLLNAGPARNWQTAVVSVARAASSTHNL